MRSAVAAPYLLFLFLLLPHNVKSLNMTVQVTVTPSSTNHLLCTTTFFDLLDPLLTLWVTAATIPYVPDFYLQGSLVLTYRNPSRRRGLRRADDGADGNKDASIITTRSLTTSPPSCTTCTSSGCTTYCGGGGCNLCGSSRRLTASDAFTETPDSDAAVERTDHQVERDLYAVDFTELGTLVSATTQSLAQSYLLSTLLDILGCLGDPLLLKIKVAFLVNQNFSL